MEVETHLLGCSFLVSSQGFRWGTCARIFDTTRHGWWLENWSQHSECALAQRYIGTSPFCSVLPLCMQPAAIMVYFVAVPPRRLMQNLLPTITQVSSSIIASQVLPLCMSALWITSEYLYVFSSCFSFFCGSLSAFSSLVQKHGYLEVSPS